MNLKELRISKGLTQKDAALLCKVPLRTYKRLELDDKYQSTPKYNHCVDFISKVNTLPKKNVDKCSITIIGAGYVGFSLGLMLSEYHKVTLIDIDEEKIKLINKKISPIKDQDAELFLKTKKLDLFATTPNPDIYKQSDFIIISLPTDYDELNQTYKMDIITETVKNIREINKSVLIVIKSTVHSGYTKSLNDDNVIFCPEFLKEGTALKDSLFPSRIIIGVDKKTQKTAQFADILLKSIKNNAPLIYMKSEEAETCKLVANTYLAMRVAFFNEVDSFLEDKGLDAKKVIEGASLDPRIGEYYNNPSFGYGGYCLPKDTQVMANQSLRSQNHELLASIPQSNKSRKEQIANKIYEFALKIAKDRNNIVIGVYSLAAKQGSDNQRNSAILDVIDLLKIKGAKILLNDENISFEEFCSSSDVVITNRYSNKLDIIKDKVYTRDLFRNN